MHTERGPFGPDELEREEMLVDLEAALRLLPLVELADAIAAAGEAGNPERIATSLGVDDLLLGVRLAYILAVVTMPPAHERLGRLPVRFTRRIDEVFGAERRRRCEGGTKAGHRCRRETRHPSGYCATHR